MSTADLITRTSVAICHLFHSFQVHAWCIQHYRAICTRNPGPACLRLPSIAAAAQPVCMRVAAGHYRPSSYWGTQQCLFTAVAIQCVYTTNFQLVPAFREPARGTAALLRSPSVVVPTCVGVPNRADGTFGSLYVHQ